MAETKFPPNLKEAIGQIVTIQVFEKVPNEPGTINTSSLKQARGVLDGYGYDQQRNVLMIYLRGLPVLGCNIERQFVECFTI